MSRLVQRHRELTLVDLLMAVPIIGTLIALPLPTAQAADGEGKSRRLVYGEDGRPEQGTPPPPSQGQQRARARASQGLGAVLDL